MDSDVEQAYAQGTTRPSYRRSYSKSKRGPSVPSSPRVNAARSSARLRWPTTNGPTQDGDSGDDIPEIDFGRTSPDPPPEREAEEPELPIAQSPILHSPHIPPSPSALFRRLRTASFSPFASIRRSGFFGANTAPAAEADSKSVSVRMASSDSSSDDDDLSIASKRVWHAFADSLSDEEGSGSAGSGRVDGDSADQDQ